MNIDISDIDIEGILLSGACFRVVKESDGSFTNILDDRVISIKQDGDNIYIKSSNYDNLEKKIRYYFDLDRDYEEINNKLVNNNNGLEEMIDKCKGYRILNQNPFEMGISYIISQSNNVKRISSIVNRISERYGKKVVFNNKDYYLFPTYEDMKDLSVEDLKLLGVGFRDKYIKDYLNNYESLKDIDSLTTKEAIDKLMSIKGIGLKVASCILLFGYRRLDVFPIDTWVKQYISDNYNIKSDQKSIERFAKDNFGDYSGLVIQYMFHSQRNIR